MRAVKFRPHRPLTPNAYLRTRRFPQALNVSSFPFTTTCRFAFSRLRMFALLSINRLVKTRSLSQTESHSSRTWPLVIQYTFILLTIWPDSSHSPSNRFIWVDFVRFPVFCMAFTLAKIIAPWLEDSALLPVSRNTIASADSSAPLGSDASHGKTVLFLMNPPDLSPCLRTDFGLPNL